MLRALSLAVAQLGDPRILRVLAASLAITLLLFAGMGLGVAALLRTLDCFDVGIGEICPADPGASAAAAIALTVLLGWLLFPAVAVGVVAQYADRIVAAVEARHYPAAAPHARPIGWAGQARLGLASAGRLIAWNALALPFYILLIVTGAGPLILFLLVNALVLGRDLGELVAARHLPPDGRRRWLAASRGPRALLGLAVSLLFMVPLLNLLAPVLGAAAAAHLFHARRGDDP